MDVADRLTIRSPSRCELEEVLQQLELRDGDGYWLDDETDPHQWAPKTPPNSASLFCALEEEADACDVFVYDPSLFTPASSAPSSAPASPSGGSFLHLCDREKLSNMALENGEAETRPLPTLPEYDFPTTPSVPSTPRSSISDMPTPSSPRASVVPPGCPPTPRSRPPSTNMGASRSVYTHATFPSISSTLSLLQERESEVEKRSGVIVTPEPISPEPASDPSRNSSESTIVPRQVVHRGSTEVTHVAFADPSPSTRARPTLNVSTSSPALRELAELASIPASPILRTSISASPIDESGPNMSAPPVRGMSPRGLRHQVSLVSLSPSTPSSPSFLLPPVEVEPPSRWSMDSVTRPSQLEFGGESSSPPNKTRTRDRLMSLISRTRAGSVSKNGSSSAPHSAPLFPDHEFGVRSSNEVRFSHIATTSTSSFDSNKRSSFAPLAITTSPSTSTASTSSSNLPTPTDSQEFPADPFGPASPTFVPSSYFPETPMSSFDEDDERAISPAPEPTLPLPSPGVPTASFFHPQRSQSAFPFLAAALSKTRLRRHKKKLVVFALSANNSDAPPILTEGRAQIEAQRREREIKKRCENIVKWCESFGPVRRVERKPDGSLHVHWKDWEVADMVCRVSGQVTIKGVGRVSLAWRYVN